ncbi:MAG: cobalamin biosynthesis protein, partial [Actinomycetota bacterium]|nr:cobalamin biosynthesis protein [Actinomycetota bacterium]
MRTGHGGEVAAALLLDALFGEPPASLHPTVWMGRAISAFEGWAVGLKSPHARRLAGIVLAAAFPAIVYLSTRTLLGLGPRSLRTSLSVALL